MDALKRTPLQLVFATMFAALLAMVLAPMGAWAAPAAGTDTAAGLVAADGLGAAADSADVFVTISDKGTLALARQKVTVSDLNADGKLTFDEAMQATHDLYCKDGFAISSGGWVTKFWGVDNAIATFYRNDATFDELANQREIAAGDELVGTIMADTEYYSDFFTFFDKKEAKVLVGDELTLTLTADSWGQPGNVEGLQAGTWADGVFTPIEGKLFGADGKVTLSFDAPGTYVVSAGGTIPDEDLEMDRPITSPYCVVTVAKKANTLAVTAKAAGKIPAATFGAGKTITAKSAMDVKNAKGAVTYSKSSGNAKITVAKNGAITVKKGLPAGKYNVKIAVKAAGNAQFKPATKTVTVVVTVNKAANTMKVAAKAVVAKLAQVKKKAVTVAPLTVTKANGNQAFAMDAKAPAKAKKNMKVNTKNGKITVKKATPKGTYKFKVKVTAKGNKNYKAKTVTKLVTVNVK